MIRTIIFFFIGLCLGFACFSLGVFYTRHDAIVDGGFNFIGETYEVREAESEVLTVEVIPWEHI